MSLLISFLFMSDASEEAYHKMMSKPRIVATSGSALIFADRHILLRALIAKNSRAKATKKEKAL